MSNKEILIETMLDEAIDSHAAMTEFNRLRNLGYPADKIAAELRYFLAQQCEVECQSHGN